MTHYIDTSTGQAAFARREGSAAAWHGLGQVFADSDTLDEKAGKAGLAWLVQRAAVRYPTHRVDPADNASSFATDPTRHVLFRSDTGASIGLVSDKFRVHHQPQEMLALIEEQARAIGAHLDTAMALHGGSVIVATAALDDVEHDVAAAGDPVRAHINYASSFDGSLATTQWFSSTRVVCWNTLRCALSEAAKNTTARTTHRTTHDRAKTDATLGIEAFNEQMKAADELACASVSPAETQSIFARAYFGKTLEEMRETEETQRQLQRMLGRVLPILRSAPGAELASARGTAWGAVNAVTYDVDHAGTARSDDARAFTAIFRAGDAIKTRAFSAARELIAA